MAKDSKGHGSDERALRKEQQATYKAGRAAQAAENRKIMGPTTGKAAQNMRDLVGAKVADGEEAAAKKHGTETLGKTGRTAKEYQEHLRSSGSPETMSRKRAAGIIPAEKNMGPRGEKRPSPASLGYHAEAGKVKTGAPSVDAPKKHPARGRDPKTNQPLKKGR